jgi:hypothetical protein
MQRQFILVGLVSMALTHFAFAESDAATEYGKTITSTQSKLDQLNAEKAALDKKISGCDPIEGKQARWCFTNGRWGTMMNDDYKKVADSSQKLDAEIKKIQSNLTNFKKNAAFDKYTTDVKSLLTDKKIFDAELKASGADLKAVYLKIDQTLLGEYTHYVAKEYANSDEMKANICKTVSTCSAVKSMKNSIAAQGKAIKSFEQFKAEMQKANPSTPAPAEGAQ